MDSPLLTIYCVDLQSALNLVLSASNQFLYGIINVLAISVFFLNKSYNYIACVVLKCISRVFSDNLQLRIQSYDSGAPNVVITTDLIVTVKRNENPPVFSSKFYSATIAATYPLGVSILRVNATDLDVGQKIIYSISDDDNGRTAKGNFFLMPDTGVLVAINPLTTVADVNSYTVSLLYILILFFVDHSIYDFLGNLLNNSSIH